MSRNHSISTNETVYVDVGDGTEDVSESATSVSKSAPDVSEQNISEKTDIEKQEPVAPVYSAFPRNRKILILGIITVAGFLGPLSGNIYIPILPLMSEVFNVSLTTINGTVSIFMAIFALAPLMWASMADFGGRKNLYIISLFIFIVANILICSVPANIVALYILRAAQAFGGSSVMALGIGTVADLVEPKHRGKAISYFMIGPQLGPIIGPLFSLTASDGDWRWTFGTLAIIGGVVYICMLFLVPETLRYLVGNGSIYEKSSWVVIPKLYQKRIIDDPKFPKPPKPGPKVYWNLIKYPPVILCAINSALLFASFYALNITYTLVLKEAYNYSVLQVSLSYICPGASLICGSLSGGRALDKFRRWKTSKESGFVPEDSFMIQVVGFICSLIGLCCYGWMIEKRVHVATVYVFAFISGFGMTWVFVTSNAYLTEAVKGQPATAIALANCLRNIAAAISSAIIHKLTLSMGYGWCFTGLGLLNVLTLASLVLLYYQGRKWRVQFLSK